MSIKKFTAINKLKFLNNKNFLNLIDAFYVVFVVVFIVFFRWKFVIHPFPLNPDEVQAGANVLRLVNYGISWEYMDGNTAGPLNTAILAWPYLFGWDVTLSTIRFTALAILSLHASITYLTLRVISGRLHAVTLVIFIVFFYGLNENPDYQHYSSELVPLILISISIYLVLLCMSDFSSNKKMLFVGFIGMLIGAVPFAKIQAAPIVVVIYAFLMWYFIIYEKLIWRKSIIFLSLMTVVPAILILMPMSRLDFLDFWRSYTVWATLYVKESLSLIQFYRLIIDEPYLLYLLFLPVVALVVITMFGSNLDMKNPTGLLLSIVLIASGFSVVRPGNMFPHYLMLFHANLVLLVAYTLSGVDIKKSFLWLYRLIYFAIISFCIYKFTPPFPTAKVVQFPPIHLSASRYFDYLGVDKSDKMLVWGWMPQWHIHAGLIPAGRESMNNNQIQNSSLQSYFKERLINDLKLSEPSLIIDAVAGKSFGFGMSSKLIARPFDELAEMIGLKYENVYGLHRNENCAVTYLRKDLAYNFKLKNIKFDSIIASSSFSPEYNSKNLDDFSITNDTCTDFWIPSSNDSGIINIKFDNVEAVRKILLMNSDINNQMNRSSEAVEIQLVRGNSVIKNMRVNLSSYPNWTEIDFDNPISADGVKFSIISWSGQGGGLNEIKVFK